MRLPRVRFTIRRLMVAVAIVGCILALGLGAVSLWDSLGSTFTFGDPIAVYVMSPVQSLGLLALVILGLGAVFFWYWLSRQRRVRRNG